MKTLKCQTPAPHGTVIVIISDRCFLLGVNISTVSRSHILIHSCAHPPRSPPPFWPFRLVVYSGTRLKSLSSVTHIWNMIIAGYERRWCRCLCCVLEEMNVGSRSTAASHYNVNSHHLNRQCQEVLKLEVNSWRACKGSVPAGSRCSSQPLRVHELGVFNLSAALLTAERRERGLPVL